jgi:KDO2-lipid IV(A) lauroyltransferase
MGIGLLCLCAWQPFRLRMAAGTVLGLGTWLFARERRYITEVNIRLCFPELDAEQQAALVKQAFIENGIGLIETASGWIRPASHFRHMSELRGGEHIAAALQQGRGVLLLGAHYSTLDFSANLLSTYYPFAVTYRSHRNPLFDAFMLRGRLRNCNGVFDRKDLRGAFRHLKQNKLLWYAPDQDYGPEQAVYAPFFGQLAASITAGSRFAAFNGSPALVVSHRRDNATQRYILEALPIPASFPSGDDAADIALINRMLEQEIRKAPAQYLWMHKRFKTRPGGKPESPYIFIKTPNRKLSPQKHAQLTAGAVEVPGHADRLQLASGLQLWSYPGQPSLWRRHPLPRLDRISKWLRSQGLSTVTVDSLYRFPQLHSSAATVFVPAGSTPDAKHCPTAPAAADFLARLHAAGCSFTQLAADNLLWDGTRLALLDPLQLRQEPGSTQLAWRCRDLQLLTTALGYDQTQQALLQTQYLAQCRPGLQAALTRQLAEARPGPHNAGRPHASP